MLMSSEEILHLLDETPGARVEGSPPQILFNKKDFIIPPDDLFETRAAGQLSYQVLADMCQGTLCRFIADFHEDI